MPAISESAGWGPASWWPRSNFAGCKDTNRFPSFSENWKRWFLPRRRLSNAGRRRRVSYARAASFNGKSGDPNKGAQRVNTRLIEKHLVDKVRLGLVPQGLVEQD